jgi:YD repeat-containing protein
LEQQIGSATTTSSLTSILHPKVTQTFNANGHLTVKTVTPEDTSPAGLQAGKQSQRYTYSVSERLLRISDGSGVANNTNNANNEQGNEIARYAYDPFGRRIKKVNQGQKWGQTPINFPRLQTLASTVISSRFCSKTPATRRVSNRLVVS